MNSARNTLAPRLGFAWFVAYVMKPSGSLCRAMAMLVCRPRERKVFVGTWWWWLVSGEESSSSEMAEEVSEEWEWESWRCPMARRWPSSLERGFRSRGVVSVRVIFGGRE
jgi:hypothetical protein